MNSLSFPDVNVWLALLLEDHVHRPAALAWWRSVSGMIGFTRIVQLSVLRLCTTAAAMNGKPLTMTEAWSVYDRLFEDDRVGFVAEPPDLERNFRSFTRLPVASPKQWADAYMLAFAVAYGGQLITFDRALKGRGADCLVLL